MHLQKRAAVFRAGSKTSTQANPENLAGAGPNGPSGGPPRIQHDDPESPADTTGLGGNRDGSSEVTQPLDGADSANGAQSTSTTISSTASSTLSTPSTSASPPIGSSPLSASSTPESNNTTQSPRNNTPIIVGAVLGAVALLALGAIILFILRKRRRVVKGSDSVGFQPDRMVVAGIRIPSFVSRTRGYAKTPVEEDYPGHVSGVGASHYDSYGATRQVDWESPLTTTQPAFLIPAPYDHGSPAGTSSFVALPERQMELQELISQAQQKILRLGDSRRNSRVDDLSEADPEPEVLEARRLKARIRELERLKDSPWARGLTDVVPKELLKPI